MQVKNYTISEIAPLPKLLSMVLVLTAAMAVTQVTFLSALIGGELLLILYCMPKNQVKGLLTGMGICALFVGVLQILFLPFAEVVVIVGRMLAMSLIFPPLLATIRMRDLRDTLVHQLHIPYEYAFMFTTALRYVPDLLSDAKHIMEAQSCRGCDFKSGTPLQRIKRYMSVLAPLVMHGLNRAETLAMSMELRGYAVTHTNAVPLLRVQDVAIMAGMVIATIGFIILGR